MITLRRPKIISRVLPEYNAPLPFSERRALIGALGTSPQDYELIGFDDDDPAKQGQCVYGLTVLGTREDLVRLVHAKKADEVILAITGRLQDDLFRGLMACYERGVDIRTRLSVKPGLTGWGQIKYGYGSSVEDALMKLQYDLYYIKHRSLTLDALVILRTIKVILAFKGT